MTNTNKKEEQGTNPAFFQIVQADISRPDVAKGTNLFLDDKKILLRDEIGPLAVRVEGIHHMADDRNGLPVESCQPAGESYLFHNEVL